MSAFEKTRSQPDGGAGEPVPEAALTPQITLKKSLGRGGMGEVWLVHDSSVNFDKAVKFLSQGLLQSERARDQFARTFANVQQYLSQEPNICVLHSFTRESRWGPWFLMRYINGLSLNEFVKRRSGRRNLLDPVLVCKLLTQAARALDRAHGSGILHRDIKPQNLMVEMHRNTGSLTIQIIDFGLAACLAEPEHEANSFCGRGGTKGYRSPEQQEGQPQSKATDQYSLAVVAFELLLGRLPFSRPQRKPDDEIPNFRLDSELNRVLHKALSWDPGDRFESCSVFVEQLQRSLEINDSHCDGLFSSYCEIDFSPRRTGESQSSPPWKSPTFLTGRLPDRSSERLQELEVRRQQLDDARVELLAEQSVLTGPVRVGICGTKNSGKSTLLACWYLFRNSPADELDIVIRDEQTRIYLDRISQELLRNGYVSATADSARPRVLKMKMSFRGRQWDIETRDFAGEHLDFRMNAESKFAGETLEFLRIADMVLVLYDMSEKSPEILNTFDSLYSEPLNELLLVLTKFDQFHEGQIEHVNFPECYADLRQKHPLLTYVDGKLRNSYAVNGLKVVPISSTGKQLPKRKPGDERQEWLQLETLLPFQIFVPLASAFQRRVRRVSQNENDLQFVNESLQSLAEKVKAIRRKQEQEDREIVTAVEELRTEQKFAAEQEALPQTADERKTLSEAIQRTKRLLERFPLYRVSERAECQDVLNRYQSRLQLQQQRRKQQDLDTEQAVFDAELEDLQKWVSSFSAFLYHLWETEEVLNELDARLEHLKNGPCKSIYPEARRKLHQVRLDYKRRWWQICLTVSGSMVLFFLYVLWF
ncbi:MAG: serine/threonine-protein kinase [Planctomycetaceae bacterium]